ncbi:MAG: Fic family protein [Micrococcales bacterium]|nr:Fic family protein [Micrococcales bacterium]MCL2666856.1 Fic family protein [Micrococcales bacterium]
MTLDRDQFLAQVDETGILGPRYAEDVLVRLAHNSAAIEGNTLTLHETLTLLVDERTPASAPQLRELYEVVNHRKGLLRVLAAVADDEPLSTSLVCDLHAVLMDHLVFDRGEYKTSSNTISGASFEPTPPSRVAHAMMQWADQAEWQTANLDGHPLLEAVARTHIDFERIHPFTDGNGRVGRAVIAYQTIRRFGRPAIIHVSRRAEYLARLEGYDVTGLQHMLTAALAAEMARATTMSGSGPPT